MLQRVGTSVLTFGDLMNIILGPIPSSKPEPSLYHTITPRDFVMLAFYMNGIFRVSKTNQE